MFRIGSTIRSANRNASTPANEIPPDHNTAAKGTLPTEHTKLSTAMTPEIRSRSSAAAPARGDEQVLEDPVAELRDEPASRNPIVISFHSICQSPRKLCATSDHAAVIGQPLRQDSSSPAMCADAGIGLAGVIARLFLELAVDEQPQQ